MSAGVAVVAAAASGSANRDLAIIIDSARSPHILTAGTGGVAMQKSAALVHAAVAIPHPTIY